MPYNTDVVITSEVSFLADLSPNDKLWDVRKASSLKVSNLYSETGLNRFSERIYECSQKLVFGWITKPETGEKKLKLEKADFCRCRFCPICQGRRSVKWQARFSEAIPKVLEAYPKHRFILLTLTVRNCELSNLRQTIKELNKAWQRLSQRKMFPAIGYVKCVEVTRSKDDTAHPHIHALLMVKPGYFSSSYISHAKWVENWKSCLKIEYAPVVNIKAVKPNFDKSYKDTILKAIFEVTKYQVKVHDFVEALPENKPVTSMSNSEWLAGITQQLHSTRAVAVSGILKEYLSDEEPDEGIESNEESQQHEDQITFGWREYYSKYAA